VLPPVATVQAGRFEPVTEMWNGWMNAADNLSGLVIPQPGSPG
jgi:hypothetical protein